MEPLGISKQQWQQAADQWDLAVGAPFPDLARNFVAPAQRRNGDRAVLKVAPPGDSLAHEISALRAYAGRGAAKLLDSNSTGTAILLEMLEPGTQLAHRAPSPGDDDCVALAANAMQTLWHSSSSFTRRHRFPTLENWSAALDRSNTPIPAQSRARAMEMFTELDRSAERKVLLHGDLHHFNLLRATRAPWLAIDPKGVIGDPAYEPATFLRNHLEIHRCDPHRPIAIMAERLALDPDRIRQYAYVHCILSAVWSAEDKQGDWQATLEIAKKFRT